MVERRAFELNAIRLLAESTPNADIYWWEVEEAAPQGSDKGTDDDWWPIGLIVKK
jgi:hypothetical protein